MAHWENECISLVDLSMAWVQFNSISKDCVLGDHTLPTRSLVPHSLWTLRKKGYGEVQSRTDNEWKRKWDVGVPGCCIAVNSYWASPISYMVSDIQGMDRGFGGMGIYFPGIGFLSTHMIRLAKDSRLLYS